MMKNLHFKNCSQFVLLAICIITFSDVILAQPSATRTSREDYIKMYKADAIRDMEKHGIPASIKLAQAILESDNGNSALAKEAKNHFGIKCHTGWTGEKYTMDDDEKNECFRVYRTVYDSYYDHSEFLRTRERYAFLFELERTDYKGWANGLKKAGYATNPKYPELLIKIIEDNRLYDFDKPGKPINVHTPKPIKKPSKDQPDVTIDISGYEANYKYNNGVRYVDAGKNDTYETIARKYEMMPWQILKYNDLAKNDKINSGDKIYLKPKKSKSKQEFHVVRSGESIISISNLYAVRAKNILKYNGLEESDKLKTGSKIYLKKHKN